VGDVLKSSYKFLDSIQAAFLFTDAHAKILYANELAESFFGYPRAELEGQRMRILFFEEDLVYFLPNIHYLTLYNKGFNGEALLRRKDGEKIFVHLFTSSFKEGEETFLTFAFHKIQRLKNLERDKSEAEHYASLGRIVEGMAHQFRNPVASIGGYANRLLKELRASRKNHSYATQILREAGKLEAILQQVEEYVRIPRPVLRKEKIQEVVGGILQDLSPQGREKGISIRLRADDLAGNGQVFIDRGLINRAFARILANSLEAVAQIPGGKKKIIEVTLSEDDENVQVSIADQGEGIAPKNLSLIFEPFFSTRPDRVGLGLTFARRVMKEHGGAMRVESQLRKGTTVTLYLPKDRRRKVRREWISPQAAARGEGEE